VKPRTSRALLIVILAASFALKLRHLDHPAVKPLDEVFHAIVARNFLSHPFTPTLVDHPYLPYDRDDWLSTHIWLHKPPMAMWQIAIFYSILGVNTLALRLPSAILSTLAAWLTYLIGTRLLDKPAALIAAALQAFNPVILMILNGYVFSDHVDISLLFWTELSIYLLIRATQTKSRTDMILCGVTQGLAFLSKTYPAFIVTVLALAAYRELRGRGVLTIVIATIATIAPWLTYTTIRFPHEFVHENLGILHHLNENVESWAAPWDQLVFNYWISIFHVFYPAIIASSALFFYRAIRQPTLPTTLISVWSIGVILPHLLATSKPMTATLIGWPAAWLIFADMISRATRGDRAAVGICLAAVVCAFFLYPLNTIPKGGEFWNQANPPFGSVMRQYQWVFWESLGVLLTGLAFQGYVNSSRIHYVSVQWSKAAFLLLSFIYIRVAFHVTSIDAATPNYSHLSEFAAKLPSNAAFLVDEHIRLENKLVEFATDRTCYAATQQNWPRLAQDLDRAGAIPYLVTPVQLDLPVVFVDLDQQRTVYACTPAARAAAGGH
jgi:4-amino-4-deoxy-L-arabinose transferase